MRTLVQKAPQPTSDPSRRAAVAKSAAKSPIRQLQRGVGNRALQQMLQPYAGKAKQDARDAPLRIQPKLTINTPGDAHEQEADRVAEQVMRMPERSAQSKATAGISGRAMTQAARVQTKAVHAGDSGGAAAPPIVHDVLRSPGQPLDAATRAFMEPRFGQDFGSVRVHTDARAAESARSVHALAYTVGQHVAFRTDSYRPGTAAGQHLLAHELAHVVQQQSQGAGSTGLQRQLDEASLIDEDDPWQKALLEAKRSVFGGPTGKPFQSDAASSLNKPGHHPFFPHHFMPATSQGIGGKDPPSYAKKPSEGHGATQPDSIGQIGLPSDQLTSHAKQIGIGPFAIGGGKTIDIDEQRRKELEKVKEKVTTSPLINDKYEPPKTGSGASVNILGKYGGDDAGGEQSLKFDLNKISVALGANIPFRVLKKMFAKNKQPNDAFDDGSKQGDTAEDINVKKAYTAEDIRKAGWNIIQHETSVRNAFLFYSQIMHNFPKSEWDAELEKFFKGEYSARIKLRRNLGTSGLTPARMGSRKHKVTKINARSSFALAVATYLHEMSHYADIMYSSRAVKKKYRRDAAEMTGGIGLPSPDKLAASGPTGVRHLSESQQTSARIESTDATIEQILKDMQSPAARPHEHPTLARRERERFFRAKQKSGFDLDKYLAERRTELHLRADEIYTGWTDPDTGAPLLELGFAFDKEAYGFQYDPKQKESWAEQFMGKFEVLFDEYLHW